MVRYGTWGSGLFQSIYTPQPGMLSNLLLAPEFLLLIAALGAISPLGLVWAPFFVALPFFAAGVSAAIWRAVASGWRANQPVPGRSRFETLLRRVLTASLFLLQPLVRLAGRLRNGLSPWRRRLRPGAAWPRPRTVQLWSESWRQPQAWVQGFQDALAAKGGFVRSGGPFDRWDLNLRAGPLGGVKIRTVVEEHGSGRQLVRARIWPTVSTGGLVIGGLVILLSILAWTDGHVGLALTIGTLMGVVFLLGVEGIGTAIALALSELEAMEEEPEAGDVARESAVSGPGAPSRVSRWPVTQLEEEAAALLREGTQPSEGTGVKR
jgi:hypothetical protein